MRFRLSAVIACLGLVLVGSGAGAQPTDPPGAGNVGSCERVDFGAATAAEMEASTRNAPSASVASPNPVGPVPVGIGLFVTAVDDVEVTENTFALDAFVKVIWCDPRHRSTAGDQETYLLEDNAVAFLEENWWPDVTIVNAVGTPSIEQQEVRIQPDGTIIHQVNISATLTSRFDVEEFPFDTQTLTLDFQSFAWDAQFVTLEPAENAVGFRDEFEIPEWDTQSIMTRTGERKEIRDRAPFSEVFADISVQRVPWFYIWKLLIPLVVLVGISWSVFWLLDESLKTRLGVSLTGLLIVVAYQFVISDDLPRGGQFTLADAILAWSFILVAASIGESFVVDRLQDIDKADAAIAVDRRSRLIFPAVYIVGIGVIALVYLAL